MNKKGISQMMIMIILIVIFVVAGLLVIGSLMPEGNWLQDIVRSMFGK